MRGFKIENPTRVEEPRWNGMLLSPNSVYGWVECMLCFIIIFKQKIFSGTLFLSSTNRKSFSCQMLRGS